MKKLFGIVILIVLAYHIYSNYIVIEGIPDQPEPSPVPIEIATKEKALDKILSKNIEEYVKVLSSDEFEGRGTGQKGNELAANYICEHLESFNIDIVKQEFSVNRGNGKAVNIIGIIKPATVIDDSIIVVGAHYDHLGKGYPGADDNASGTAAVMSIAPALQYYKNNLRHTILLQFYSAEEMGLIGSKYYVNNPILPINRPSIDKHIAMINLDMVGFLKDYRGYENTIIFSEKRGYEDLFSRPSHRQYESSLLRDIINKLSSEYKFAKNISSYRPSGSDHAPFYGKGIPVVFLHTGTHPYYHKPTDTPNRLNYNGIEKVARLATEIIIEVDQK